MSPMPPRPRRVARSLSVAALTALALAGAPALAEPTIVPPRMTSSQDVAYPENAKGDAEVILAITVEKDGTVRSATAESGPEPFASAAADAALSWRFEPATRD